MPASDVSRIDALVPALYDKLRDIAHSHLRHERTWHTLGTTALVHEAWIRLAEQHSLNGAELRQFFGAASNTMRNILVDHARRRRSLKRGGGVAPVSLDQVEAFLSDEEEEELVALDAALTRLAAVSPRGCEVVQHRFFSGLSLSETAEVLGVSSKTVQRDWLAARAWLRKEIARDLGILNAEP